MKKLVYSGSPHIRANRTTKGIMLDVIIALVPAMIAAIYFFGLNSLLILLVSVASALASEVVYRLIAKEKFKQIFLSLDNTSIVTGILVGLNMPASVPLYVPLLASVFAIVIVKMLFGGTGKNIVNPAAAGRVFVFMSFGVMAAGWVLPIDYAQGGFAGALVPITGATPLSALLSGVLPTSNLDLFLGLMPGVIGETCKLALILGGIYLCIRGVIDFKWPLIYIATTGLFAVCLNGFNFDYFLPSILSGGLMLGAIFMATDYTTSPNTLWGNVLYFVCMGLLTAGLRHATKIEVVSFVILLMNLVVPLIDRYIYPRAFGKKSSLQIGLNKEKAPQEVKEVK